MSNPSIKPKAAIVWGKQTEKLKKRFSALIEGDLYFEDGKLEEMLMRIHRGSKHDLFEFISKI
jgi:hypothetical protein